MLIKHAVYRENRRLSTVADIAIMNGSIKNLEAMRDKRKRLARIYAEDGAIETARCIEEVDIVLLDKALAELR